MKESVQRREKTGSKLKGRKEAGGGEDLLMASAKLCQLPGISTAPYLSTPAGTPSEALGCSFPL